MKIFRLLVIFAIPAITIATPPMNMDPAIMEKMMNMDPAEMQSMMGEMQRCMESIDMKEMEELKIRGEAMERELKSLCNSGKRDAAMDKAMVYSKEIMNDPGLLQVRECSQNLRSMMPGLIDMEKFNTDNIKNKHICDSL